MRLSEFSYSSRERDVSAARPTTVALVQSHRLKHRYVIALAASLVFTYLSLASPNLAAQTSRDESLGPIRLVGNSVNRDSESAESEDRPTQLRETRRKTTDSDRNDNRYSAPAQGDQPRRNKLAQPSEFERYVQRAVGDPENGAPAIRRFGAELMRDGDGLLTQDATGQIPQDYQISIGDEIQLTIWGSVDADLRLVVDRSGRISVPRVGPVMVAGLRYAELVPTIDQRVGQVFKNYKLSASLGRLRSIRVYVTGFTEKPGAYSVSSLATLVNALMRSGGPSASGSFRNIELLRGGKLISNFDFYALLLKGDKTSDRALQNEDVIHIGAVGPQVALIGSVNVPAVFELRSQETVEDLLAMAGGFTAVADRSRLTVERLDARNDSRISEMPLPASSRQQPRSGDLLRAFSAVDVSLPQHKQNKRVRVEGEVLTPGDFILPANATLSDAIQAAGGLTAGAYVYGTDFSRESVRVSQQENYERALRDLETEFTRATTTQRALTADEAAAQSTRSQGSNKLIERLRAVRPTGRIVLQLQPTANALPNLLVEDGDRLLIPPRPTTIGVFGSVFNGGSYLYSANGSVRDFLRLAGGPTRGADADSIFVLRANGSVISARQRNGGWMLGGGGLEGTTAEPGDTIFVPEELNKTTFMQEAKEWTQILYQFGLGAAALKTIKGN